MTSLPPVSFAITLASISLIAPFAIHLFFPAIPVIKAELGLTDAEAQLAFAISLFTMGIAPRWSTARWRIVMVDAPCCYPDCSCS